LFGTNRTTLIVNVWPGASGTRIFTVPPSRISPSILVKVEFQATMPSALVNSSQTVSGGAWIRAETAHRSRKGERVCTAVIALLDMTAEDIPSPGRRPVRDSGGVAWGVIGITQVPGLAVGSVTPLMRTVACFRSHPLESIV
jgi:hypothetical protein